MNENGFKPTKSGYLLEVKVVPNASKAELIKTETGFKARVQSAPVDGKANDALIALLSKEFGVAKRSIEIAKGKTSKSKVVLFKTDHIPNSCQVTDELSQSSAKQKL